MADILKHVILSDDYFPLGKPPLAQENNFISPNTPSPSATENALLKEQAREEGYKIGFEQGLVEGLEQGKKLTSSQTMGIVQQLNNVLQVIPDALNESRLALKAEIADIVLAIVQQLFIQQQCSKEVIAQQITAALTHLNDKQKITLALHPQDLTLLRQGALKIDFSQYQDLQVIADETLTLGGCRIKTEHGLFDAGIERQIDGLKQALLQIKKRNSHE
ncbi:FliH/SctL family protein [Legionella sp.]|uniref:FliH/SctL family protein n=1 Tax=Legionella sp. TaxID=459 RepID=UPI0032205109